MNNSMNDLMNLISVLCGGYCLYTWFRLVREKKLFENGILLPKDRKPEDCFDEDAYIRRLCRPEQFLSPCKCELFAQRAKSLRAVTVQSFSRRRPAPS